jgi:hypothetical protein
VRPHATNRPEVRVEGTPPMGIVNESVEVDNLPVEQSTASLRYLLVIGRALGGSRPRSAGAQRRSVLTRPSAPGQSSAGATQRSSITTWIEA